MSDIEETLGKTISVYKITETTNDRGDVTRGTSATVTAVCEIQVMSGNESEVRSGILQPSDALGFFKPNENVVIGDEVDYQNTKYMVVGIFDEQIGSSKVFKEIHLKKIIE